MATPDRPRRRPLGRPSMYAICFSGIAVALLVAWTALVALGGFVATLDQATLAPVPDPANPAVQVAAALGVVFWPGGFIALLLGLAWWAQRRRLRNVAIALAVAALPGSALAWLMKLVGSRPRPDEHLPQITEIGPAYPSEHIATLTTVAIMVAVTAVVTRQRRSVVRAWQIAGVAAVLIMAASRWLVRANWVSDLVGGLLLGATVAAFSLMIAGVRVLPRAGLAALAQPRQHVTSPAHPHRRCAVIVNPSKIADEATFRRHVSYELQRHDFQRTLWLETSVDDPGHGMAKIAVGKEVDLVVVAGGDGTVRSVCQGLADSGIPLGIVPAGTGNLLARNLGIPLDERAAIDVAFDGRNRVIDLVQVRPDDQPESLSFSVMAGMGFDALIFDQTADELKRAVGSAAYFVTAARAAGNEPFQAKVSIDDHLALRRRISLVVIGNVGELQGGIRLFPEAVPDDGLLEVLVASPRSLGDWARLATKLVVRSGGEDAQLTRLRGRSVEVITEEPEPYQLDGDTIGHCRRLSARTRPGALTVRVPG
ncbi:YegS/Rv2252/BmrU family lipid kinase [Naumannella cuiyingiana]|uniref:YegS/Rv2252/BmrU family lipid kinase n=1 Tax=Naumannella cuiyingiana TaxID=1347891 RepID=A0A7Z0IL96_9ACTN|nr:diacylglycerol kinase family protein [Naumannella cuiyingiana]NYI71287.1 YegS/Rv2252/BmrU family lipid kinase [Naumannella cuiyingiana]